MGLHPNSDQVCADPCGVKDVLRFFLCSPDCTVWPRCQQQTVDPKYSISKPGFSEAEKAAVRPISHRSLHTDRQRAIHIIHHSTWRRQALARSCLMSLEGNSSDNTLRMQR